MKKTSATQDYVAGLRAAFDELHKYQTGPSKLKASPIEHAKKLFESVPDDLQSQVLDKAVGTGIRRFRAAASVLALCKSSENVDRWIRASLTHSDPERRGYMVQVVGEENLVRFADEINEIIKSDEECRWWAVSAAGALGVEGCLHALIELADSFGETEIPMALIAALARYDSPLATPHLQRVFNSDREDRERGTAAGGLARQNQKEAIHYLVSKLDEHDGEYFSAESRRAARALSDVFGWGLESTPEAPRQAKERWTSQMKHRKDA